MIKDCFLHVGCQPHLYARFSCRVADPDLGPTPKNLDPDPTKQDLQFPFSQNAARRNFEIFEILLPYHSYGP